MAQIREIRLVDDLTGDQADETLDFALDNKAYEIDLTTANAKKFRDALAEYVGAARRTYPEKKSVTRSSTGTGPTKAAQQEKDRIRNQRIRAWAPKVGMKVSDRGRIPAEVLEAFAQADPQEVTRIINGLDPKGADLEPAPAKDVDEAPAVEAAAEPEEGHSRDACDDLDNCPQHADTTAETVSDGQEVDPRADWTADEIAADDWHTDQGIAATYKKDGRPTAMVVKRWRREGAEAKTG